ncbi:Hypothetical protein CINCED_3A019690 [Cinara cedri]|uniref:Reverse transcriptase domain n=1 Tax=Cinara cedri TaxID=506608 RepID=A0A5E4M9G5_9HEMI|nr:Hypothetical protein CINCED_3A019690 [Cinara cedri]
MRCTIKLGFARSETKSDLILFLAVHLSPNKRIQEICCKALKVLGFILRSSKFVNLVMNLKILYCALVRPIVEYGSVLWGPETTAASVERVQRRFLHAVSFCPIIPCPIPHDYSLVLCELQ